MLTVGSLFSGIGGLDLGLERAGMTVKWQAEVDPYCCKVLNKHWPDVPNLGDVKVVEWEDVERVDLVCGGFPCQPVSTAGRRLAQDDERWLWPEVVRALRVLRPRYLLLENVPGLLTRGFGDVLGDLAESGYDAEWDCIPAAAVGAPHLRYRVFVVARLNEPPSSVPDTVGNGVRLERQRDGEQHREPGSPVAGADGPPESVAHSHHVGSQGCVFAGGVQGLGTAGYEPSRGGAAGDSGPVADSEVFDLGPGLRTGESGTVGRGRPCDSGGAGLGHDWATEPDVGRVAYGVPNRVDRLKGLGNAVVPQVAEWVGRRLLEQLARV